jgi:hypothetical protein
MSTRLTCPGCGRALLLPADCTAELLSCPRCLARIPNPQAPDTSAAIQATPPAAPPSAPPPAPVRERGEWGRGVPVDVDVRRDSQRTNGCLVVLAVLGAIGICYALLGGMAMAQDRIFQPLLLTLGLLAVFTIASIAWVYSHRPSESVSGNIGRTVLGVLTITGAVVTAGFLLVMSGLIILFVVCLANGGKC